MKSRPPKTIDPIESDRLLEFLRLDPSQHSFSEDRIRNYTMALLMLDTGIRVGELVQLRIWDLYFGDKPVSNLIVRAEIAKLKKERLIPISERLYKALQEMHNRYWSRFKAIEAHFAFFQALPTNPLSVRQVQRIIKKAGMVAAGRQVTPHTLRHTFASRLMRKVNARIVQELLGHAQLTSTQIYMEPNHTDLKEAIDKL